MAYSDRSISSSILTALQPTVYLRNFGRTQVNSAFSCYLASATGWTFPKPPAILATLPVRWLSCRANSNLVVLLSISNGRTSAKSLAAQILFVMCYAVEIPQNLNENLVTFSLNLLYEFTGQT